MPKAMTQSMILELTELVKLLSIGNETAQSNHLLADGMRLSEDELFLSIS